MRKILSDATALREARRRYGKAAAVKRQTCGLFKPNRKKPEYERCTAIGVHSGSCRGSRVYFTVGVLRGAGGITFFAVLGEGDTWAEAFEKAAVSLEGKWHEPMHGAERGEK